MDKYGLIGYPLGHSFSKRYFTEKFSRENITDSVYELYPIEKIELIEELVQNEASLKGLSVTIPYKETIIPYLTSVDPVAKAVGAVNAVKIIRSGGAIVKIGFNTDYLGFQKSITPMLKSEHKKALILGTGGASKAVAHAFVQMGVDFKFVSRQPVSKNQLTYKELTREKISEYKIIVNTTPLGTYPNNDTCPDIPYEYIANDHILFDLVYNPEETTFMKHGKRRGAIVSNGYDMLRFQAEEAWKIWQM